MPYRRTTATLTATVITRIIITVAGRQETDNEEY